MSGSKREPRLDPPSVCGRTGIQIPAERTGPLTHAHQPEMAFVMVLGGGGTPVVGHDEPNLAGVGVEIYGEVHPVARRVAGHVCQRLPTDAVQRSTNRAVDARRRPRDQSLHVQPGPAVLLDQSDQVSRAR